MKDDKLHWIGQGKGASAIGSSTSVIEYKKSSWGTTSDSTTAYMDSYRCIVSTVSHAQ